MFSRIINSLGSARVRLCARFLCHEIFVRRTTPVKPITVVTTTVVCGRTKMARRRMKVYRKRWQAGGAGDRILACPWRQGTSRKAERRRYPPGRIINTYAANRIRAEATSGKFLSAVESRRSIYTATGINIAMIMRIIKFALCPRHRTGDGCYRLIVSHWIDKIGLTAKFPLHIDDSLHREEKGN